MNHTEKILKMIFISCGNSSKILEPCEETFHLPPFSVSSERSAILCFWFFSIHLVGSDQINPHHFKTPIQWITVVCFISYDPFGKLSQKSLFDGLFHQYHFMRRSTFHVDGVRKTRAVCNCHDLRALTAFSLPNSGPPFLAGEKLPSIKASRISTSPRSRRSSASIRSISSKTPSRDQRWNQRWQVWYGGYLPGKSFQGAPVLSIQRIPFNTSLGFFRERPRGSLRVVGIKISNNVHCSSVKSISHMLLILLQMSSTFF